MWGPADGAESSGTGTPTGEKRGPLGKGLRTSCCEGAERSFRCRWEGPGEAPACPRGPVQAHTGPAGGVGFCAVLKLWFTRGQ